MNLHLIADSSAAALLAVTLLQDQDCKVMQLRPSMSRPPNGQDPDGWTLLQLNTPLHEGLALIEQLRQAYPPLGIVVTAAGVSIDTCMRGYGQGADIFLNRAAESEEVMALVNAQIRSKR